MTLLQTIQALNHFKQIIHNPEHLDDIEESEELGIVINKTQYFRLYLILMLERGLRADREPKQIKLKRDIGLNI